MQSSRTKFDLEHCEGDLCWSRSESEGRIERAECHLHRGGGLGNKGNEDAERSGVHDEEQWTKDRALGDTAGGCVPGRQVSHTFDTEAAR